jgi:hypothetical protein
MLLLHLSFVPPILAIGYQDAAQETITPTQYQELQDIKNILIFFGNDLVSVKNQVGQEHRPYQAPYQLNQPSTPPFQDDSQSQRRNFNPRPSQDYNHNAYNSSIELVPIQNNIVQEYN